MAEDIKFGDILRNPHFSQFAALLSVPYCSMWWRKNHPEVPFWIRVEKLSKLMHDGGLAHQHLRDAFTHEFTSLIRELVKADPKLYYRQEDMEWFAEVLSGKYATATMSMLFAMASAKQTYLTPIEVAEATDTSESNWRNKAAAGEIIGAVKAGKQWLIPVTSLLAYGIAITMPGHIIYAEENTKPVEVEVSTLTELYAILDQHGGDSSDFNGLPRGEDTDDTCIGRATCNDGTLIDFYAPDAETAQAIYNEMFD